MSKVFRLHKNTNSDQWFASDIYDINGGKIESKSTFDKGTIIWRYLDFTKFISLLEFQKIHFTRLDDFYDKFEGAYPSADYERFYKDIFWSKIEKSLLSQLIEILVRLGNFASCWHINEGENYGMWKSYINSNEGIAIKTTVGNLMDSLDKSEHPIIFGNVEYVDLEKVNIRESVTKNQKNGIDVIGLPSFFKRTSFSFEQEFRAIIPFELGIPDTALINQGYIDNLMKRQKRFYQVPIKLNKLIDEIYLHPDSSSWFNKLVEEIIKRYEINATVRKSEI